MGKASPKSRRHPGCRLSRETPGGKVQVPPDGRELTEQRGARAENGGWGTLLIYTSIQPVELHSATRQDRGHRSERDGRRPCLGGGGVSVETGGASVEMGGEEDLPPRWGVKDAVFHEKGLS